MFAGLYFDVSFGITKGFATDRLGPVFWPRLLAVVLAALAAALMVRAGSGRSDPAPPPTMRVGLFAWVLAMTAGYALVLPELGFVIATPLLLGALIWLLGLRQWRGVIGAAVGMTLVLYVVFVRALHVLLPMGPIK